MADGNTALHSTGVAVDATASSETAALEIAAEKESMAQALGDDNDLHVSVCSPWAVSFLFARGRSGGPHEETLAHERAAHRIWHGYFHRSRNINPASGRQGGLVVQLLTTRQLGILTRSSDVNGSIVTEKATTPDGAHLWKDLPYFVEDMTNYWLHDAGTLENQRNFAAFLGALAAVGLDDRLCWCALTTLRDAFETDRPLRPETIQGGGAQEQSPSGSSGPSEPSVLDLLPTVNSWLYYAGEAILRLSESSVDTFSEPLGRLGPLAAAAGVDRPGFGPRRFMFWLERMGQIAEALPSDEGKRVLAERGTLLHCVSQVDFRITREVKQRGLLVHLQMGPGYDW